MMSTMQHKRLSVQRRAIVQRFICAAPCDCARKSSQMRSFIEMCKTVLPLQLSQKTAISCFSNPAMHGPSPAGKTLSFLFGKPSFCAALWPPLPPSPVHQSHGEQQMPMSYWCRYQNHDDILTLKLFVDVRTGSCFISQQVHQVLRANMASAISSL